MAPRKKVKPYGKPPNPDPEQAFKRFIVKEDIPDGLIPVIQPRTTLGEISLHECFKEVGLGIDEFVEHVATLYSDDSRLEGVKDWWERLHPKKKAYMTFDHLAAQMCIPNRDMFALLSKYCYDMGQERAKRVVALNLPGIMESAVFNALQQGELSQLERKEILRAAGFYTRPSRDSEAISVQIINNQAATSAQQLGMPSFEDVIGDDNESVRPVVAAPQLEAPDDALDVPFFMANSCIPAENAVSSDRVPSRNNQAETEGGED